MTFDEIIRQSAELMGLMGVIGFAGSAFLVLAISGLCSVLHTFNKVAS